MHAMQRVGMRFQQHSREHNFTYVIEREFVLLVFLFLFVRVMVLLLLSTMKTTQQALMYWHKYMVAKKELASPRNRFIARQC